MAFRLPDETLSPVGVTLQCLTVMDFAGTDGLSLETRWPGKAWLIATVEVAGAGADAVSLSCP